MNAAKNARKASKVQPRTYGPRQGCAPEARGGSAPSEGGRHVYFFPHPKEASYWSNERLPTSEL
jgi:hypothetical protein